MVNMSKRRGVCLQEAASRDDNGVEYSGGYQALVSAAFQCGFQKQELQPDRLLVFICITYIYI